MFLIIIVSTTLFLLPTFSSYYVLHLVLFSSQLQSPTIIILFIYFYPYLFHLHRTARHKPRPCVPRITHDKFGHEGCAHLCLEDPGPHMGDLPRCPNFRAGLADAHNSQGWRGRGIQCARVRPQPVCSRSSGWSDVFLSVLLLIL